MGYLIGCRHYMDSINNVMLTLQQLSAEPAKQKVYKFYYSRSITIGSRVIVSTDMGLKFAKVESCTPLPYRESFKYKNVLCVITNDVLHACLSKKKVEETKSERIQDMESSSLKNLIEEYDYLQPKVIHGDAKSLLDSKVLMSIILRKALKIQEDIELQISNDFKDREFSYCPNCGGVSGLVDAIDDFRQYECYTCKIKWEIPNDAICK